MCATESLNRFFRRRGALCSIWSRPFRNSNARKTTFKLRLKGTDFASKVSSHSFLTHTCLKKLETFLCRFVKAYRQHEILVVDTVGCLELDIVGEVAELAR